MKEEDSQRESYLQKDDKSDVTSFKSFERHESDLKDKLSEVVKEENMKMNPKLLEKLKK